MIEELFSYVKKKYGVEPDYPFSTAPDYPVLRHEDNRKWFANVKHFFTSLGKKIFTLYGKEFFTLLGKQFFT